MPILPSEMDANRAALAGLKRETPLPPPERMTTAKAVAELAPEIRALLKAGHSLDEIAKRLIFGGRSLSARQLQRYLTEAQSHAAKKKGHTAKNPTPPANRGATGPGSQERSIVVPSTRATGAQPDLPPRGTATPVTAAPVGPSVEAQARGTAGPLSAPLLNTPGSVAPTGPATHTANPATAAGPALAKPQSTASPAIDSLSVSEAQIRSINMLTRTAPASAKVDRPRETNITWSGIGTTTPARDDAQAHARPEPGTLL
ncbi:hypothetical protein MKK50_06740 [Methylobacterium sp. J-043]|nr:hypothetical protein [Methylobacterium sp. J-043]